MSVRVLRLCLEVCPEAKEGQFYHHTDGLGGIQGSVGLSDLIVEASLADHGDKDVVRLSGDLDTLGGHFAEDTECIG